MAKLIPFLFSNDARAQAQFYVDALGGQIESLMTYEQGPPTDEALKDKVMHLCLTAAGNSFFMADAINPLTNGKNFSLNLEFASAAEGRSAFDHLAADGTVEQTLEPVFWGGQYGQLVDKFGVSWMITCPEA